jgi:hypothetical protein
MTKTILITGGTGLVGTRLTEILLQKGYQVRILGREKKEIPNVTTYTWDIKKQTMDTQALIGVDAIIHLAGAGIADERWTDERKKEILESRTQSAQLLYNHLPVMKKPVNSSESQAQALEAQKDKITFISASGIGIYGSDSGNSIMKEDSKPGSDFLAEVCKVWENSAEQFENKGLRTVMLRIGVVLSEKGGALPKLIQPIRLGAGAALGSGKQMLSWIHIDDLCNMFIHTIENKTMQGAYNAVAPQVLSNIDFTKQAAKVLHRWILPFNVPAFGIKAVFGEMTSAILSNNIVSAEKIVSTGFQYQFPEIEKALKDLLN